MVQRSSADASYEGMPLVVKPIAAPIHPVRILMIWSETVRLSDRARAMIKLAADAALYPGRHRHNE